ncbi:GIY-YIG nuclease family protein [Streptomyces sp. PvR006]|uniref:GIY-YIG nuclease family protein n=1 Tax=Streptomyces sp. PvR006 TaxID=2817860 RepID=UPI001FD885AB|nr:GIY-YIG nuclease family protein [Streptomyces sp. PvR006]
MLSLIEAGEVTAGEVRALLGRVAAKISEKGNREGELLDELMSLPTPRTEPEEKDDGRQVYAVSSEAAPKMLKIGVTGNLRQRLKALQTGSGSPLIARWTSPGGGRLERNLHNEFSARAVGGEWFDFSDVDKPIEVIERAAAKLLRCFEQRQHACSRSWDRCSHPWHP